MRVKIILKRKLKRLLEFGCTNAMVSWGIIIFLVFVAIGIYNFMLLPQIDLKGKNTIIIDYKDKYVEKGYKASFLGNDVSKDVSIKGKVNPKKIGVYKIVYKVKVGTFTREVTRKVIVKDRKRPKLGIDDSDIYLCPGDDIVPDKVKAIDEYEGDLTEKVKYDITKDKITYSVSDKSGNKAEITKKIIYKDIDKPKLTLKGNDYIYLFVGDEFNDPGYEVSDNCDKEISSKVKVSGGVDTSKVGEYVLTYSVSDSYGNDIKISRKVKVSERPKDGTVYLTFDDGPQSGTTNVILDILKEENVKATFFVTNKGPDELIKRMYDEGHSLALHTASHDYSIVYSSVDAYFDDLYSVQDRVKRITGYEYKIIRFPGGSSNTISRRYTEGIMSTLTNEVVSRGFKYYDWNLSSGDAAGGHPTAENIKNNVINGLRKDRVNMVLMHDIKPYTRDALRDIIRYGRENGYAFEKITMETEMIKQRVNN